MFDPITNHVEQALGRLITQYKDRPNIRGLMSALIKPIQKIEDTLVQMNTLRSLDNAIGQNLDNLGTILGLARFPGDGDTTYRNKLKAKVKLNTSEGEPERIIETFQLFTGATQVILHEHYPAEVFIDSDYLIPNQETVDIILGILESVAAAGVRIGGFVSFDPSESFAFDGPLPGLGFGNESDPLAGGMFGTEWERDTFFEFEGNDTKGAGFGSEDDPLVGGRFSTDT